MGKEGDFLIDYESGSERLPYCSCDDFHFRVLSGKVPECYHLMAAKKAIEEGQYAVIGFADGEYEPFLRALLSDLFSHL